MSGAAQDSQDPHSTGTLSAVHVQGLEEAEESQGGDKVGSSGLLPESVVPRIKERRQNATAVEETLGCGSQLGSPVAPLTVGVRPPQQGWDLHAVGYLPMSLAFTPQMPAAPH